MNTFYKTKSKLAQWWEGLSPKIDEAYQVTKEKAGDFGHIGKLKYEIFQTQRILLKCYQELGDKTAARISEKHDYSMQDLENIDDMISQIRDLKNKVMTLESEIIHLQAEEKIK